MPLIIGAIRNLLRRIVDLLIFIVTLPLRIIRRLL